ncbi:MAG TPA: dTDP-4-amino-4,6-dideoxygalactose transaminase [Kofleriaceae bacterium]|nr:dTDP-4-amino-4,6-dideoxygalactose transaminase [Kofleriaceae bacterium]
MLASGWAAGGDGVWGRVTIGVVAGASGRMLPFARHVAAPGEAALVAEALASGHVSGDGPFTARAGELLAERLGAGVLLTTSCTHALELAGLLLGVGRGDEVVLPSFTFSSTANAFALRGAVVRFADVDPGTFSMEWAQLEAALTPRTRVVVAMAYGGVMRDLAAIAEGCAARGIALVEDAAHGLFASAGGRPVGTFGRLGALSFHATKNVSCGEGGAIVLNDASLAERAVILREKGTDRTRFLRGEVDKYTWQEVGSSYLPSDLLAAVLVAQLEHAEASQARRHAIWDVYRAALAPRAAELGLGLQVIPPGVAHPAHVFAVTLPARIDRASLLRGVRESGVAVVSHYEPLHLAPAHAGRERLPVTEDVAARLIRLPLHAAMSEDDAARVAAALLAALERAGARA